MTDRINAFIVVLDRDYREDDVEPILTALRMVRGVVSVVPHVADLTDQIALERTKNELRSRVYEALRDL